MNYSMKKPKCNEQINEHANILVWVYTLQNKMIENYNNQLINVAGKLTMKRCLETSIYLTTARTMQSGGKDLSNPLKLFLRTIIRP